MSVNSTLSIQFQPPVEVRSLKFWSAEIICRQQDKQQIRWIEFFAPPVLPVEIHEYLVKHEEKRKLELRIKFNPSVFPKLRTPPERFITDGTYHLILILKEISWDTTIEKVKEFAQKQLHFDPTNFFLADCGGSRLGETKTLLQLDIASEEKSLLYLMQTPRKRLYRAVKKAPAKMPRAPKK